MPVRLAHNLRNFSLLVMTLIAIVSLCPVFAQAAAVSPSNIITYQGRLLGADGVPVSDVSLNMIFTLYSDAAGGSCLWSNSSATCATTTARAVTLTDGLFTEDLGDTTLAAPYAAIADTVFSDDTSVYLQVVVAGETLTPRKRITATAYALNAQTLDGLDSSVFKLFKIGTNGTYEDDAATIIGADAAFTHAGGAAGDLRVTDELEVIGNSYFDGSIDANGQIDLGDNGETFSIDSLEFDVSSSTGSITINDGGGAGQVSVQGTILDINSLDFIGAGSITSSGANNITLTDIGGTNISSLIFDLTGAVAAVPTISSGNNDLININDGLSIGVDGVITEDMSNTSFSITGGNDLYVADMLGVNGYAYFDNPVTMDNSQNSATLTVNQTGSASALIINSPVTEPLHINGGANSGTSFASYHYLNALTINADLSGVTEDLQTNLTINEDSDVTGYVINLPALTTSSGGVHTTNIKGYVVNGGAQIVNPLASIINWSGFYATTPNLTQTTGTLTASGLNVTNGTITTAGTQNGLLVSAVGVAAGVLNGVSINTITPGGGTETGLLIGTGWDDAINVNAGKFLVETTGVTSVNFNTLATTNGVCHSGANIDAAADDTRILVACSAGPADYAEWYETDGNVTYADIVSASESNITFQSTQSDPFTGLILPGTITKTLPVLEKATDSDSDRFLAVVSTSPIQTIGSDLKDQASHPMPVALNGRVPVHITNEGGTISVGDPIAPSSTPGYGKKATEAGRIVGYALNNFSDASGEIEIYVQPSWYAGNILTTDGSATLVSDTLAMNSLGTASAETTGMASQIFALRGSGWNGSEAEVLNMKIQTEVTDADDYRLSIKNTTNSEVAYITSEGTMTLAGDMIITGRLYPSDRGAAQTSKYIYYDGSAGPGGDMMRTNAAGWSTGSYDFAEMFPASEPLTAGDVVVFTNTNESVGRAAGTYNSKIAGVISTRPGFLAGENQSGHFPVALAGRVPTKVNLENGAIAVGDPLTTSSTAGYAMKATQAGQIVGYALEPYSGNGSDNKIVVFINVGYFDGAAAGVPGVSNTASLLATGASANFTLLNLEGDIYMGGNDILNIGRLSGLADLWSIEADGTIQTQGTIKTIITSYQNEKVETTAMTSAGGVFVTLVGTSELQNGMATITFEDIEPTFNDVTSITAPIRVIVTPSGPVSLYVSEKDHNGFSIIQINGSDSGISFDWIATAYRKDYEPEATEVPEVVPETQPEMVVTETVPETTEVAPETTPEATEVPVTPEFPAEQETPVTPETPTEEVIEAPIVTEEPSLDPARDTEAAAASPIETSDPTVGTDGGIAPEPAPTDSASTDSSTQTGG